MINSFSETASFFRLLSDFNTLCIKNECETIIILIQSMCDIKIEKINVNLDAIEYYFDDVLDFLYDRLRLAKTMEWGFLYDTTNIIIKKSRILFSKLYNYYFDFRKHNAKYD